jgi:uncharacterized membrane protein
MHYFPLALPFLLFFALLLIFLVFLVEVGILRYAYERIGLGRRHMFALLALSFLGSYVNIPVYRLPPHVVESGLTISFQGMRYVIPEVSHWPGTVVAVNVGGALVPAFLSLYLLWRNRLYVQGPIGVALVTVCTHLMAYPVRGVGIAEPMFVPPLIATAVALVLSRRYAPPLAYASGSLGTLIGADVLNLGKVQGLGAPVAAIGGAGTFDGIFLTGILSVLLVSLMTGRNPPDRSDRGASGP